VFRVQIVAVTAPRYTGADRVMGREEPVLKLARGAVLSWLLLLAALVLIGHQLPWDGITSRDESESEAEERMEERSLPVPSRPLDSHERYISIGGRRLTYSDYAQDETSIAADPNQPNDVIAAFKDFGHFAANHFSAPGVLFSRDGGDNFSAPEQSIALPADFDSMGGDPTVTFDGHGRGLYLFLAAGGRGDPNRLRAPQTRNNGVFLSVTTTGGRTWSEPTPIVTHVWNGVDDVEFEDKPSIAVDVHPGSPFQDRIYACWTRFYPGEHPNVGRDGRRATTGGGDIVFARSADGGEEWNSMRLTDSAHEPGNTGFGSSGGIGSSRVQGSDVAVANSGDVYVVYWFGGTQGGGRGGRVECARSVDGGETFQALTYPFGSALGTNQIASPLPHESFRTNAFPSVQADPTRPGNVYVVSTDAEGPDGADQADIFIARSTDSGVTWKPRIRLNDDRAGNNQCFPAIAVNGSGDLVVAWYDSRDDAAGHRLGIYFTTSRDGGATWTPNRPLSTSFEPNTNQFPDNHFFCDYLGVVGVGDQFHALWTDTRRPGSPPEQEVYYARLQLDHLAEVLR
jgi:hypothetical protein